MSAASAQEAAKRRGPLSPDEALQSFQLLGPELTIELVAAEPDVIDPVAIRFDELGQMWVVEMRDYPSGPKPGEQPLSKIKRLEDRDNDGRYETATTFAENLLFPTGLQPWKGGVIVTLAGRVAYFADDDRDGKADRIEDWYTGFVEENPQLRANHPTLALDNHIYIANGLRGGEVRGAQDPSAAVVSISGRDFRFEPLSGKYESVSGNGQFGLTFDNFGRRFICSNRNPLVHVVMEDRYLKANPRIQISEVVHDVAAAGEKSRLYPLSQTWTTSNLHANQFTAACGVLIYRDHALGLQFHGSGFTCDPTGNLIHCEVIKSEGATFTSTPAKVQKEFLASTDEWFRPVNLEVGPDGALYVVDMYRAVIEHPDFVPDELKHRPDERFGDDRGRVYRVHANLAREKFKRFPKSMNDLVQQLSESSWRADTAARLILERRQKNAAAPLRNLIQRSEHAEARIRALWLLRALGELNAVDVAAALGDTNPRVREQACILAEPFLADHPNLVSRLNAILQEERSDSRLCFQAVLSLSSSELIDGSILAKAVMRFIDDSWMWKAVAITAGEQIDSVARNVLQSICAPSPEDAKFVMESKSAATLCYELHRMAGMAKAQWNSELFGGAAFFAAKDPNGRAALIGLLESWDQRQVPWRDRLLHDAHLQHRFKEVMETMRNVAADSTQDIETRLLAVALVVVDRDMAMLKDIALKKGDQSLRVMAIQGMAGNTDRNTWSELFAEYAAESPPIRAAIVNAALAATDSTGWLLDELEAGRIRPQELGRTDVDRLANLSTPEFKERAAKILAALAPEDRQLALARYRDCLTMEGDPKHGREIFSRSCANCHRIGDVGVDVAPDISDSRTKTFEQLLGDIVQPNRAIDGNYISYIVQTDDGRSFTGIIAAETATSITLREAENKSTTLSRDEIDVLRSTGLSLMPEGLEQNFSLQDMADLLSFIKNWRYLDGQVPLGGAQ